MLQSDEVLDIWLRPDRPVSAIRDYRIWCGRRDSNPHRLSPNGFSYQLRLSPPPPSRSTKAALWSGLYLHLGVAALGAARLVSKPPSCFAMAAAAKAVAGMKIR